MRKFASGAFQPNEFCSPEQVNVSVTPLLRIGGRFTFFRCFEKGELCSEPASPTYCLLRGIKTHAEERFKDEHRCET